VGESRPDTANPRDAPLLRLVFLAYLAFVVLSGAAAVLLSLRDHFDVPFVDDWRVLDHYASQTLPSYLFTAENGHRLPVTLALFAIDHEWLGGRMRLLVVASISCMLLAALLLGRIFRRNAGWGSAPSRTVLCFACFTLFWAASCNDLLRGLYHMNLQALVLVLIALSALARLDPTRPRDARRLLCIAVFASLLATLSQGAGAASWAALVAVALLRRLPWRISVGLAATGAAAIALFAATLPPHPKISFRASLGFVAEHPLEFAGYALSFVGAAPARVGAGLGIVAPVPKTPERRAWAVHTRDLRRAAVVLGSGGLLVFLVVFARRWRRPSPEAGVDAACVGLMCFGLAAALLVAFARAAIVGPAALVQPRFVTWSASFWIGAVCALAPRSRDPVAAPLAFLVVLGLPILSLCMLPALRDAREFHATTRSQAQRLELSLLLGLRDDALARNVALEDAELVYRVASRLEAEQRWPFQGPLFRLRGTRISERFAPAGRCTGGVDRVQAIDSIRAAAVSGWIARGGASRSLRFVVLADEDGVVRGIADAAAAPPRYATRVGGARVGWTGFIADYDPAVRYEAYAVLGDGDGLCALRAP